MTLFQSLDHNSDIQMRDWHHRLPQPHGTTSGGRRYNYDLLCPPRYMYVCCRIVTLRAKLSGAVYCYRSCLWVCNGRAGAGRAVSVTSITRNCVLRFSPNWVCRWFISSWLNFGSHGPAPPRRGSATGRTFLVTHYYGQRAVFASLRALFFINIWNSLPTCFSLYMFKCAWI